MAFEARTKQQVTVEVVIIRADGTRENLGVIASTDEKKKIGFVQRMKGLVNKNG